MEYYFRFKWTNLVHRYSN